METKEILKDLREKNNLTQDEMAERLHVTRQAVSRWETGETQPNTDTLNYYPANSMFRSIPCSVRRAS